jgi:hypothetical protein
MQYKDRFLSGNLYFIIISDSFHWRLAIDFRRSGQIVRNGELAWRRRKIVATVCLKEHSRLVKHINFWLNLHALIANLRLNFGIISN